MSKFKVGDTVKILRGTHSHDTGTVVDAAPHIDIYSVNPSRVSCPHEYSSAELDLVYQPECVEGGIYIDEGNELWSYLDGEWENENPNSINDVPEFPIERLIRESEISK